jgi:putative hydrolase of the HAD superfamily
VNAPIRGVIFDLFHTLTGKESEWSDLPWTSDVLGIDRRLWDELLTSRSRWRLAGEERDPFRILTTLAREADPSISDERIQEALRVSVQRFRHALQRIPSENIEVLKALRASGLSLGLISNADVMEVEAWHDCPLAGLFDAEVFSCDIGCVKPEPAIYEHCLRALGVSARECLFVGDGGSNELTGAKNVGLTTVFVSGVIAEFWPERVQQRLTLADYHVECVAKMPELLGL